MYSRFRPTRRDPDSKLYHSYSASDVAGPNARDRLLLLDDAAENESVRQTLNLEAHELFTQLQFTACLVQLGPRRGVFLNLEAIVEKKTIRIRREWLAKESERKDIPKKTHSHYDPNELDIQREGDADSSPAIWVDHNRTVGLKVRVRERKWRKDAHILMHRDEAFSYSLELEGTLPPSQRQKAVSVLS